MSRNTNGGIAPMRFCLSGLAVAALLFAGTASAGLNTTTYVSFDGSGTGAVEGDATGVGEVTLLDSDGGDMWNDGDNFIYLHDSNLITGDFTATVRVVAQTEAIDGRWGKGGIRASNNLGGTSSNARAEVAAGNGSQPSGSNPVPVRLSGRTLNVTPNGYEGAVTDAGGADVPNDVFRTDGGVNVSWLSLSYTEADNAFVAGFAPDVGGAPGEWSFSDPRTNVEASGNGWYVGLAFSAHSDLNFDQVTRADNFLGVTFDNYSLIPEPSSLLLLVLGGLGLLGFRRRR